MPSRKLWARAATETLIKTDQIPTQQRNNGPRTRSQAKYQQAESTSTSLRMPYSEILPSWLTRKPPVEEDLVTESLQDQQETAEECLPYLLGEHTPKDHKIEYDEHGLPQLAHTKHVKFLKNALGTLPPGFAALDASRPWVLYWCLTGLSILGEDISAYRENLVATLKPIQHPKGGFGGGNGQYAHLATTYASVLSLVMVGGPATLDLINRKAMWQWLGDLKQSEGDFMVCVGGERDVRGAYCAMVILSLLNLPVELPHSSPGRKGGHTTFLAGLPEWISQCQTYEGGLSAAPGTEAHGAYTFCALACLCILGEPHITLNKYLDMPALLRWLSARQHAPEGGLAGRTNKLVDGCYSHWIGGCWPLVEAAIQDPRDATQSVSSLWSREGLTRYIICCCQASKGGLRDKPSKGADTYHSCYNLAGLSSALHYSTYQPMDNETTLEPVTAGFRWTCSRSPPKNKAESPASLFDREGKVTMLNPVYVIPQGAAETARKHFKAKPEL